MQITNLTAVPSYICNIPFQGQTFLYPENNDVGSLKYDEVL